MKRIVLCCDGTWNSADQASNGVPCPTNVIKLGYRVANRDPQGVPQIIYYDQGVGTGNLLDRISGGALGDGLEDNIHDAYRFLVVNYEKGDELFFFGFSRGAFTARSIVGMVRKCGILGRPHVRRYKEAIELYRTRHSSPDEPEPRKFREKYCLYGLDEIEIRFIGVWDTVGALGIPLGGPRSLTRRQHQFHNTELSGAVKSAYHALAIDEHRGPFEPAPWVYKPKEGQRVEQVWFCGVHSDVGGGYAPDEKGNLPSDIPLQWMIDKARAEGLAFDQGAISAHPLSAHPTAGLHNSMKGPYYLMPKHDRVIGKTREGYDLITQSLHQSVRDRWDQEPSYRPPTLEEYFRRVGDPRATGAAQDSGGGDIPGPSIGG